MQHQDQILKALNDWLYPLGYKLDDLSPILKRRCPLQRNREFYVYPSSIYFYSEDYKKSQVHPNDFHLSLIPPNERIKDWEDKPPIPKIQLKVVIDNYRITKACPFNQYTFHVYLPK